MKNLFYLFILFISLISCEDKHKKDTDTNIYYSKYLDIYNSYDSLGTEATINLLDEYISEFPNAQKAYIFKAWILANDNKIDKIDDIFIKALKYDSTNAEVYMYWASLLLKDSNNIKKAERINKVGLRFDKTNLELLNNEIWIELFKNNNSKAYLFSTKLIDTDTTENYRYYRTAAISSLAIDNDSLYTLYFESAKNNGLIDTLNIKEFFLKKGVFNLYNKLK